ncbi:MAG: glycosyltransferase family 9 protein [Planctomycetaceae bacterium]
MPVLSEAAGLALRQQAIRRIVVIKPSALGDVVQSLPLARVLQTAWPGATVHWVINREFESLLSAQPRLAGTIPFQRRGGFTRYLRLLSDLRSHRFDLVLDLQGLLRTGVMTRVTGARLRLGLQTAREGSHLACTGLVPGTERAVPAHARYWRVAEWLGLGDVPRDLELALSSQEHDWAQQQLQGLPRPVVAVHAGAAWVTKRWPPAQFAQALRGIAGTAILVGSGGELPLAQGVADGLAGTGTRVLNLAGQTSLKQLAALLGGVDAVLSNDSGPMHLAAGLGTPVVGLFTCTSPVQSGPVPLGPVPLGPVPAQTPSATGGDLAHALVATTVECAASYRKECPFTGERRHACFAALEVARVREALGRVVSRGGARQG